jgi:hypothetical protein
MDNIKKLPAVIVDYDTWYESPKVQQWVAWKAAHAELVLLVTNSMEYPLPDTIPTEWTVIIQNTGQLTDFEFKVAALNAVRHLSNMIPAIGIDNDPAIRQMFEANGVLYTTGEISV